MVRNSSVAIHAGPVVTGWAWPVRWPGWAVAVVVKILMEAHSFWGLMKLLKAISQKLICLLRLKQMHIGLFER
jgi:hypothetical protein